MEQGSLPKGGRARQVNMTARLADTLRKQRHLRGERIFWRADGHPKMPQVLLNKWMSRIQRLEELRVTGGIPTSSTTPSTPSWRWWALRRRPSRTWPGTRISTPSATCT
ncbi:hypothetical protein KH5H1_26140 [Corallococcus caeni]|nr:hypothetical protein KH5H1_26140 [Corallococcus sp. KH5-1]